MNLEKRINLLVELGKYCGSADPAWQEARQRAHRKNGWFTPEFIDLAIRQITQEFLQKDKLEQWAEKYRLPAVNSSSRTVGLIMAGNIPLVGFHDFLALFLSGHRQLIKPSARDNALIRHLVAHLETLDPQTGAFAGFAERLNGCDAYIATGSNNSARYFDYYFGKYPHIIRRNRTSVAILDGGETAGELEALADDVYQYFGLGCRNVTKLYVPENYDFLPLLEAFRKYDYLADLARYKHNYDYQLTLLILNKKQYMSNQSILLTEDSSPFSPISVLHYEYYPAGTTQEASPPGAARLPEQLSAAVAGNPDIQCVVSRGQGRPGRNFANSVLFGTAQRPGLNDYADGVDTLQFLRDL
jgi:hypothetical protein